MSDAVNERPRVSVITPFFNGDEFMDEAVSSVLAQIFKSWELLFVDDGSTDGSSEKAKCYADLYSDRIRYFEHPGHANLGQSASRNLAIQHARGEYIAFLDVDDVWLPEKLERQVATLDANQEAAMTYGPYFIWLSWTGHPDDLMRDIRGDIGTGQEYDTVTLPPAMLLRHILNENGLPAPCGAMVRRIVLEDVRGFEQEFLGVYEDEAMFAKIALNHPVYVSSSCWDRYRQHANSYCERSIHEGVWDRNPSVASDHRIRLLRWLLRYVSLNARFKRSELLGALQSKMEKLGVSP